MNSKSRVAAVVVTHNRLSLLEQAVGALRAQIQPADMIFIVDNGSTDGTAKWSQGQPDLRTIQQGNLGSAGGQYAGIHAAFRAGFDWIWCMDDDTLPRPDTLRSFLENVHAREPDIGFLASVVLWTDGSLHPMNLTNPRFVGEWLDRVHAEKALPIVSASFVSILVHRRAVEKVGYPVKEFFVWGDDIEYTRRISRHFSCYTILDSIVIHQTASREPAGVVEVDPQSPKFVGLYRNNVALIWLEPASLVRRIKRLVVWMMHEIGLAGSVTRSVIAFKLCLRGIFFAEWLRRRRGLAFDRYEG
jgi:rhamnopyranosyl-N-acetylglucosaminyl-diphospho-decaprenol beta-1,3/1,4-galactofuranosyltransferase